MNIPIDNLENGMLLYREEDESDYAYEDYLADEADRRWKEGKIQEMLEKKDDGRGN